MKADNTIKSFNMLLEKERVLCALSGGADSVALTHWLARNAKKLNIVVAAAHFSHGIRKDAANYEKQLCYNLCRELDIEVFFGEGDSINYSRKHKLGLEEAARELRYAFLEKVANEWGADKIATAHHADDNIETVIMNACRGAGVAGLAGIPPVRDKFIRPLLETRKCEIETYIADNGLEFATDETNFEVCCRRNQIRLSVLPHLRSINADVDGILIRFSYQAYIRNRLIECKAQKLVSDCKTRANYIELPIEHFKNAESSVVARAIRLMYEKAGGRSMLTAKNIEAVVSIIETDAPSSQVYLPGIIVKRRYDHIIFTTPVSNEILLPKIIKMGQKVSFGLWETEVIQGRVENALWLDGDAIPDTLILRSRQKGDMIVSGGHHKSLKKLFIDKKIPKDDRDAYPVLTDGNSILAVPIIGKNDLFVSKAEKNTVSVIFRRIKK